MKSEGLSMSDEEKKYRNIVTDDEGKRYTIRKLTPKKCFRLMGFTDEEYDRLNNATEPNGKKTFAETAMYRFAGNSIVVDTLACVFESAIYGSDNQNTLDKFE